jgi:hypothetical protein
MSSALPSDPKRLVQDPDLSWSARHSQQGCRGAHEAGVVPPPPPTGTAPSVSTVVDPLALAIPPALCPAMTAVLTTLAGQAVFRVIQGCIGTLPSGEVFRLRKGSRIARSGAPRP